MGIIESLKDFVRKLRYFIIVLLLCGNGIVVMGEVETPKITSIQLHEGSITISWAQLSDPGITEYKIQVGKYTGNPFPGWSNIPLPTIGATKSSVTFSYSVLKELDVHDAPVPFAVKAFRGPPESSTTDLLDWDSTIFVEATFDSCLAEIALNWTPYDYNMWEHGLKEYKVMVSENGGAFSSIATLQPSTTEYVIEGVNENVDYQIYISAVADTLTLDETTSFVVGVTTNMQVLPDYIYADFASYSEGKPYVQFSVDPKSEITTFNLLRAGSGGSYDSIARLSSEENLITYLDGVDYKSGPYFYRLDAINNCENKIITSENIASTILLEASGEPLTPELNWNEYQNWINGVAYYSIERKLGKDPAVEIAQVNALTYEDLTLEDLKGEGVSSKVCYTVKAFEQSNPFGNDAISISNTTCVELPVNIRFEYNAFSPGSSDGNDGFGPTMDYLPTEFDFSILDRGGHVVFETKDPYNARWNGTYKGRFVTQGAYLYVLKYRIGKSKPKVLRGGLAVVYPK